MSIQASSQHPGNYRDWSQRCWHCLSQGSGGSTANGRGFGGKETQAGLWHAWRPWLHTKQGRPVKYRMARTDDMVMTGKRHDF